MCETWGSSGSREQVGRGRQEEGRHAHQTHLCPPQQGLHFFVVLDGRFKRMKEIRYDRIYHFFVGLVFLMNYLQ